MFVKNHNTLELLKFFFSALIMIVPTILLGSLFPMVTQICISNYRELGKRVGTIYSINTLGNIIGSFLAGFILIPNMGIQNSIILGAYLNIAVGCAVLLSEANLRLAYRAIASITASALGITSILIIPSWDKMIISSGAAAYAPMYAKSKGEERKQNISGSGEELLYYKEGLNATITVKKRISGTIVMAVDGKVDASSTGDMYTQLLLAHLPLLLNPDAKSALVIGLGSGVTLSAAAQHELDRIDCVEIEPAVVEASKFFSNVNRDVLSDPRVNMIVNDGRNYLAGNKRRYDVIISEPSNLWLAGIANLFSSDFYKIAKSRLNPGGVLCQWSHIYYMSPDDMKVVINTFRSVFPHASIWFSTLGDILMIGTQEELRIDYLQLAKHYNISGVMDDLQRLSMREPLAILSCYLLDESGVARLTTNSRISSDNHPVLEFSVPRSIYENTSESNRKIIKGFQTRDFPEMDNFDEERVTKRASFWYHLGVAYDYKDMSEDAQRNYEKAISVDPVFTPAYEGLALSLYKEKEANKAIELLKKAIAIDPSGSEAYYNLGQIYFDQGLISDAVYNYKYAVELSPGNDKYKRKLSEALSKSQ